MKDNMNPPDEPRPPRDEDADHDMERQRRIDAEFIKPDTRAVSIAEQLAQIEIAVDAAEFGPVAALMIRRIFMAGATATLRTIMSRTQAGDPFALPIYRLTDAITDEIEKLLRLGENHAESVSQE